MDITSNYIFNSSASLSQQRSYGEAQQISAVSQAVLPLKGLYDEQGQATVEFVVFLPVLLMIIFVTAQIYEFIDIKQRVIESARHAVWESCEGKDIGTIRTEVESILNRPEDLNPEINCTVQNTSSISGFTWLGNWFFRQLYGEGLLPDSGLRLNTNGRLVSRVSDTFDIRYLNSIDNLLSMLSGGGSVIPSRLSITENYAMITDPWDANDAGQVKERITGLWLYPGGALFSRGLDIFERILGFVAWVFDAPVDIDPIGNVVLDAVPPPSR